tara:strand:+ start:338 stop:733 length:396 start_codon:yes stop_codon:yes gene_type:complete
MSQYFLPTVIQTNFSDTKNVLTKKHQSNIQSYDDCLRLSKTLKPSKKTPEEMAIILDKMRKRKLECKKTRPIQVLDSVPKHDVSESRNICKAFTLSGKKCTFKAVCGDYCKKHRIDNQVLGTRPKINISLL